MLPSDSGLVIPYTQSRAVGQSGVLRVGRSYRPLDGVALTGCAVLLLGEALGCSDVIVAGLGMATEVTVAEGVKLKWTDGDYRYELFYRTAQNPEVAGLMAGSMVELTDLESRAVLAFQGMVARMPSGVTPAGSDRQRFACRLPVSFRSTYPLRLSTLLD